MDSLSESALTFAASGEVIKLHYYPDTDSICIELRTDTEAELREVADGVDIDLDALATLETTGLQQQNLKAAWAALDFRPFPAPCAR